MISNPIRILEIEDNIGDAFYIVQMLDETAYRYPYVIQKKEYVGAALQVLEKQTFDIILCDLHLPDSRGLETLTTINTHAKNAAIIVLTSINDESTALQALHQGAQDYLVKGQIDSNLLIRSICYAIERKKNEINHLAMEEKLRQSQKLEAIGRLASDLSHHFNNILQVIVGYASLLATPPNDQNKVALCSTNILNAAGRASALIKKTRYFSSHESIVLKKVNIHSVIEKVESLLRPIAGSQITINLELEAKNPFIRGDEDTLISSLLSLGINASDAIPTSGAITIKTRNDNSDPATPRPEPADARREYCIITVSDNGCGMDNDTMNLIFEPFFTTKESGKNIGLGLADVYSCIKRHNGKIEITSSPNEGTTFTIVIPVHVTETQL